MSLDQLLVDTQRDLIAAQAEEIKALREIIADLSYCAPNASLEFMRLIPAEVRGTRAQLALTRPSAYTESTLVPPSLPEFMGAIASFETNYDLREYIEGLAETPYDGLLWRDLMEVANALAAAARQGRDVEQARGEAPQSGPNASEGNAHNPSGTPHE